VREIGLFVTALDTVDNGRIYVGNAKRSSPTRSTTTRPTPTGAARQPREPLAVSDLPLR